MILCSRKEANICSRELSSVGPEPPPKNKKTNICIFINSDHRKIEKLNLEPNNATNILLFVKKTSFLSNKKG